jgi:hypothetical protein
MMSELQCDAEHELQLKKIQSTTHIPSTQWILREQFGEY